MAGERKRPWRALWMPVGAIASTGFIISAGVAFANTAAPAVIHEDKAIPLEQASDLKTQPLAVLYKFPAAGPKMAEFVAKEVAARPAVVDALLSIMTDASPQQASAIGAGMVRGVRALDKKQAPLAKEISEKIAHTENPWLKTTFNALGPNYTGRIPIVGAPVFAENIPNNAPGGTGTALAKNEWRVGPEEHHLTQPIQSGADNRDRCSFFSVEYQYTRCRGTVVALVTSDGPSNGAVSTSPTM